MYIYVYISISIEDIRKEILMSPISYGQIQRFILQDPFIFYKLSTIYYKFVRSRSLI